MQVQDFSLPKTVDARLRQMMDDVLQILNDGEYEFKIVSSAPAADSPGFQGEVRHVLSGATMRKYIYASGNWYYTDAYTKLT